jgi:serine/threonine protein kinase/Tol biopolymer transport system component
MINSTILNYKILEKIGQGGMGVVYKAYDTKLQRTVALKFLPENFAKDSDRDRFLREARAASAINHPNVCTIYDLQEYDGTQFIVMELIDGSSLKEIFKKGDLLSLEEINRYAYQLASALRAAHEKGVIHRDIKSENIMLTGDRQIKVMDFGLAKIKGAAEISKSASTAGTLAYMSPEQLDGRDIDVRSDIFSFGVVLYEMVSGQLPFKGDYPSSMIHSILNEEPALSESVRDHLSLELILIVKNCLEKSPDERYQSFNSLMLDLKNLTKQPEKIQSLSKGVSSKTSLSRKIKTGSIVAFTITIIIILVFFQLFRRPNFSWLSIDPTILTQATSERGLEYGRISPDGKYIFYRDSQLSLKIKELSRGTISEISPLPDGSNYYYLAWHPESTLLLITGFDASRDLNPYVLIIINISGKEIERIYKEDLIGCAKWSSDGSHIAMSCGLADKGSIIIQNFRTKEERKFQTGLELGKLCWSPDSRYIAFLEYRDLLRGNIRLFDTFSDSISAPLQFAENALYWGLAGGITWGPSSNYIIYAAGDSLNFYHGELNALPIDPSKFKSTAPPIKITTSNSGEYPAWPTFTSDGKKLSFTRFLWGDDIYTVKLSLSDKTISGPLTEIATSTGNDLLPTWNDEGNAVLYSSNKDGMLDIYEYDEIHRTERRLTYSPVWEGFPQYSADDQTIYFSHSGKIWSMPIRGGESKEVNTSGLKIGDQFYLLPDGERIVATLLGDTTYIMLVNTLTSETEKLSEELFFPRIALSHDGKKVVFTKRLYNMQDSSAYERLVLADVQTGAKKILLTRNQGLSMSRIPWTKDDKYVIYETLDDNGSQIRELVDVLTGETRELKFNIENLLGYSMLQEVNSDNDQGLLRVHYRESNIFIWEDK